MADLSFRCPYTGLMTLAQGRLLEEPHQAKRPFGAMKVDVDFCMGCGGHHVLTIAETLTLDLTGSEIEKVTRCCLAGNQSSNRGPSRAAGAPSSSVTPRP